MKTCNRCGQNLPLALFQTDKKNRDGKKNACRSCCSRGAVKAREAEAKVQAALSLEQQARTLALKELVGRHRREFDRLLADHRLTLKVDGKPKWIEVS